MKKLINNCMNIIASIINYNFFKLPTYLIVVSTLICSSILTVKANENTTYDVIDFSKKGTISITLSDNSENTKIEGANITIYKLADAYEDKNNIAFNYHQSLTPYHEVLEQGNISDQLLDIIIENEILSIEGTTNALGIVEFDNLDLGLYLISQTNKVEGYSSIDPFLVMIPEILDNQWNYSVEASPKVDIIRLMDLFVEKRWDTINTNNTPKEVTIELLKKGEVIDTVILNNENNWTHNWTQIEKSDEYSVREINIPAGYTATYRQVENKFIVTNTKTLVQTGQNILIIELLVFIGLIFIITGVICEKRKNHE